MKTRVITAIVALCFFLPFLYFSDTLAFTVLIQLLAFVSTYEILRCVGLEKRVTLAVPCYVVSLAVPFLCRYPETMYRGRLEVFFLIFFVLGFLLLSAGVFYRGKQHHGLFSATSRARLIYFRTNLAKIAIYIFKAHITPISFRQTDFFRL